ncbi:uncharacterized protein ASCRUDRAFT_7610 [Ascoidea rubescens DSM 1968]|uniref:Pre-mRNA-splicing factor CEF1 n=1 Tax=Ascoidea rubescens DSM 1968 TaxID=1344418 RepID=A0A1D2VIB5_9ASCO|nr:hypothetical protein ASCRUDRAFT_7610 [Ascoidea rubescens DSM 1968]ODV61369.1 hypothetical protein ASCRUDRAFT_7610 [Ascoidea rubescens DSM 1968]
MPPYHSGTSVWTNVEDEVLRAAISKYGLNQWSRCSSLLSRKTAKQCKSRWKEWLDPSIKKIQWSTAEDASLLRLVKILPNQYRTIAPIVGRTPTQCIERYQYLLNNNLINNNNKDNEQKAILDKKTDDSLNLTGINDSHPSNDPLNSNNTNNYVFVNHESRAPRPDAIDMDDDEKEMLAEAKARLANTQGKKAKRKNRERLLQESKRIALLQKKRELKNSNLINSNNHSTNIVNSKSKKKKNKNLLDYNEAIPFYLKPKLGAHDIDDEYQNNQLLSNDIQFQINNNNNLLLKDNKKLENDRKNDKDQKNEKIKKKMNDSTNLKRNLQISIQALEDLKNSDNQISKRRKLFLPFPNQQTTNQITNQITTQISQNLSTANIKATKSQMKQIHNLFATLPKPKNDFEIIIPDDNEDLTKTKSKNKNKKKNSHLDDLGESERLKNENDLLTTQKSLLLRSQAIQNNLPIPNILLNSTDLSLPIFNFTQTPNSIENYKFIQHQIDKEMLNLIKSDYYKLNNSTSNPSFKNKNNNDPLLNHYNIEILDDLNQSEKDAATALVQRELNNFKHSNFKNKKIDFHFNLSENEEDLLKIIDDLKIIANESNSIEKNSTIILNPFISENKKLSQESLDLFKILQNEKIQLFSYSELLKEEKLILNERYSELSR